jgi:hypothetical protein
MADPAIDYTALAQALLAAGLAGAIAQRLSSSGQQVLSAEPLLTKAELAKHLHVNEAQVDRFVRKGMPRETIGSAPRFDLVACRAWLAAHRKPRAATGAAGGSPTAARSCGPIPGVTPAGRAPKV